MSIYSNHRNILLQFNHKLIEEVNIKGTENIINGKYKNLEKSSYGKHNAQFVHVISMTI